MCRPISAIVTRNGIFFGTSDSHEVISEEHHLGIDSLTAFMRGPSTVRVELLVSNLPISEWPLVTDQDRVPGWYDHEEAQRAVRHAVSASGIGMLYVEYALDREALVEEFDKRTYVSPFTPSGATSKRWVAPRDARLEWSNAMYTEYMAARKKIAKKVW